VIENEVSIEEIKINLSEMLWPQEGHTVSIIVIIIEFVVHLDVRPFEDYADPFLRSQNNYSNCPTLSLLKKET
jgi:hypothetical protein